ncbi:MAG: tetratricopeptide repeat protein, partial [Paludibacter sp.]
MKKLTIILMGCLLGMATVFAQNTPSISGDTTKSVIIKKTMPLKVASLILQKSYDTRLRKIAFGTVVKAVKAGTPEAMHLMGMAYYTGMSVNRDFDLARRWFEAANRKGYLKSAYNLAMMYRLGIGVKQDFGKAYQYLCRAGEEGQPQAVYGRGYMHYKGLGCTQSYDSAMTYFKAAADKGHGYSMFMMGLCYRNGYGVERNSGEANYWLKKASDKKVNASVEELSTDTPENPLQATQLRSANAAGGQETKIKKVRHALSTTEQLQGIYTGTLATYDWSGQHVIKESPLEVTIEQNGNNITASWNEDTLSTVIAKGILTDTALVFTEATYSKCDHYHRITPANWDFMQATLTTVREGKTINLAGNLQLYS